MIARLSPQPYGTSRHGRLEGVGDCTHAGLSWIHNFWLTPAGHSHTNAVVEDNVDLLVVVRCVTVTMDHGTV